KPLKLIKRIINSSPKKDAVILDFFAGSGTTGEAVLQLNNEDSGQRRFILCTNNEGNIFEEITYIRIKNSIYGYNETVPMKGSLKCFKTDFVENVFTRDQLYYDLTEKCIPMLCTKENTFKQVEVNDEFVIYSNEIGSKYTFVYFNLFGTKYEEFKEKLIKEESEKALYIFTLGDYVNISELKDVKNYKLEAIPNKILDLYKKLIKLSKED
ncbi:MAG: DNA methyltransferase, partial [Clostridia bacterium]|nr:DNA methyltransferase [Clostridia bacterium]